LLFIDDPDSEYARLAENADEAIGRAKDMLKELSAYEKLHEEYLAREKAILDHYASLKTAEKRGIEMGKLQTAAQMLKEGMPIELVCKYTGLSVEVIKQAIEE